MNTNVPLASELTPQQNLALQYNHSKAARFEVLVLIWLAVQNSLHILMIRYVRSRAVPEMFLSSVAVFFTELCKVAICVPLIALEEGGVRKMLVALKRKLCKDLYDTFKVCIPAMLYTIQNNLFYYAATHLTAATFMVASQLKIFTTAIFSVLILKKYLSMCQRFSLVILFVGIALIQMNQSSERNSLPNQKPMLGFAALVVACTLSGFAGVYFERILKSSAPVSIWMRNMQLSAFCIPSSILAVYAQDYAVVSSKGFLSGFDFAVWFLVLWYGIGGLSVSLCIKYANNVSKNFATSIAIIMSTAASTYLFGFIPDWIFVTGSSLVIASVFLYSSSFDWNQLKHSIENNFFLCKTLNVI